MEALPVQLATRRFADIGKPSLHRAHVRKRARQTGAITEQTFTNVTSPLLRSTGRRRRQQDRCGRVAHCLKLGFVGVLPTADPHRTGVVRLDIQAANLHIEPPGFSIRHRRIGGGDESFDTTMLWRMTLRCRRGKSPLAMESIDDRYCRSRCGVMPLRRMSRAASQLKTEVLARRDSPSCAQSLC